MGRLTPPKSAVAYAGRGQAVFGKGALWATYRRGDQVVTSVSGFRPGAVRAALADFNTAIDLAPKLADVRGGRAECYFHLGDPAKEVAYRKELATIDKTDAKNFNTLDSLLAT